MAKSKNQGSSKQGSSMSDRVSQSPSQDSSISKSPQECPTGTDRDSEILDEEEEE